MDIYSTLNEITLYIDTHLKENLDMNYIASMMGVNAYTMQRIFSLLVGETSTLYIKKRRLTNSALDLLEGKSVMEVALDYRYNNATSFSRAFREFHGMKPSEVKKNNKKLKLFYRKTFQSLEQKDSSVTYDIVTLEENILYGIGIKTDEKHIGKDAPLLWKKMTKGFKNLEHIKYAMVTYSGAAHECCDGYYILFPTYKEGLEKISIPKSKWLRFIIPSQEAKDIQKVSHQFYFQILPSCKFNLKDIPELEYYHDNITEFLIPIY